MTIQKLFVIVPVYNEELNIPRLFDSFESLHSEFVEKFNVVFVLVDDGSQDKTVEVARVLGGGIQLEVHAHTENKGPGAAFATAFSSLTGRLGEADWVITMEGDNTSRHELIRQMFKRADEGFDVVLASPYMYGGGFTQTSFLRKLLSSGANLLVKDLLGIQGILTVSSFFRLFRGKAILRMHRVFGETIVERPGFESMVEMLMKMIMLKLSISEIAMQLDSSRRQGKSKMKLLKTIRGYLTLWSRKSAWQFLAKNEVTKP